MNGCHRNLIDVTWSALKNTYAIVFNSEKFKSYTLKFHDYVVQEYEANSISPFLCNKSQGSFVSINQLI